MLRVDLVTKPLGGSMSVLERLWSATQTYVSWHYVPWKVRVALSAAFSLMVAAGLLIAGQGELLKFVLPVWVIGLVGEAYLWSQHEEPRGQVGRGARRQPRHQDSGPVVDGDWGNQPKDPIHVAAPDEVSPGPRSRWGQPRAVEWPTDEAGS